MGALAPYTYVIEILLPHCQASLTDKYVLKIIVHARCVTCATEVVAELQLVLTIKPEPVLAAIVTGRLAVDSFVSTTKRTEYAALPSGADVGAVGAGVVVVVVVVVVAVVGGVVGGGSGGRMSSLC